MFEWVRFIIGTCFLLAGIVIFGIELYGVFHFKYIMNRMHMAAIGDTFGIGVSIVGLMIFSGFHFVTLKLGLIVIFLWMASPVSSHVLSRLEIYTNENIKEYMEVEER